MTLTPIGRPSPFSRFRRIYEPLPPKWKVKSILKERSLSLSLSASMEKNRKDVYLRYIFFSKAFLSIVEATSTLRNFQGADDVSFVRGAASKTRYGGTKS